MKTKALLIVLLFITGIAITSPAQIEKQEPTLEQTLVFIKKYVERTGCTRIMEQVDNSGKLLTSRCEGPYSFEIDNSTITFKISYEYRGIMNKDVTEEYLFKLSDIKNITSETWINYDSYLAIYFNKKIKMKSIVKKYETDYHNDSKEYLEEEVDKIYFITDCRPYERLVKAFKHAVALCGGKIEEPAKEPF